MYSKIKHLASVSSGYSFRGAIMEDKAGDIRVLQAKHVKWDEDILSTSDFTKVSLNIPRSGAFLQKGDVVIVSRGMNAGTFRSAVIASEEKNVLASSSVLIIRVQNEKILPEYLSLYLNSRDGQNAIAQRVSGINFQTLLRSNLEEIEIPVPSIGKQLLMVELYKNFRRQEEIAVMKTAIKKNLYNELFRNITAK